MKKQINIFIISPNDVNEERAIAKEVCQELDKAIGMGTEINAILWEDHPMTYHKNAQANIDNVLDTCDIFIVVLWHRLGSVVEGYEGALTQNKNVTGTQYEIEKILASERESIFFYFKTKEKHFSSGEVEEASRQRKLLDAFLEDINLEKGSTKHGYQEFKESAEFRQKLLNHLVIEIERRTKTKIKLPIDDSTESKNMNSLYILIWGLAIFMFGLFLLSEESAEPKVLLKKETSSQKIVKLPMTKQNTSGIYLEIQDKDGSILNKKTYNYFLEALTKADIEVFFNDNKRDFKVKLTQDIKQTTYVVSDMEMIKVECILSYVVVDLHKNSTIKAQRKRGVVTHFNSKSAKTECLDTLYDDMSKTLIKQLIGLK